MIRLFAIALTLATALVAQAPLKAQVPAAAKTLLKMKETRGTTFSMLVRDLSTGRVVAAYDTLRQVTPASVLKLVTTATASSSWDRITASAPRSSTTDRS